MTEPVGETPVSQDIPEEETESLSPTPPSAKTPSSTSNKSQLGDTPPQDKSPSISPQVKPIVIEKVQEPLTPTVLKMPHQNPEPNKKSEDIQRRNIPRFAHYRSDQ